ncbi:MAG: DUF1810 domain-containing protein [Hyphomicrobium sp.]|jgi:uncharacterized protein (DUF1810 family)
MPDDDPYDLQRFVSAQHPVYDRVLAELRAGRKQSHWMWFVFPQISGLGSSPMSRRYAISCRAEATAYFEHPVLGPRLRECTRLVNAIAERKIGDIFASPDDMKFHSSMTLFSIAASDPAEFNAALAKYFGYPDAATLDRLAEIGAHVQGQ